MTVCCLLTRWLPRNRGRRREPAAAQSRRQANASCSYRSQIYRSPESRKPQIHRRLRSNIVAVRMLTHYAKENHS
jgi:hypothetical protein